MYDHFGQAFRHWANSPGLHLVYIYMVKSTNQKGPFWPNQWHWADTPGLHLIYGKEQKSEGIILAKPFSTRQTPPGLHLIYGEEQKSKGIILAKPFVTGQTPLAPILYVMKNRSQERLFWPILSALGRQPWSPPYTYGKEQKYKGSFGQAFRH